MQDVQVDLSREWDWGAERHLASHAGMRVSTFRYDSGVHALRIAGGEGEIVMLPFQGQQVWDARFGGRSLTMRTMFDQPIATRDYVSTYGAFLIHCGATAMGPPGEGDDHAVHGELPNARFDRAWLRFGEDEAGAFVAVGGSYRHTIAFRTNYVFRPEVRFTAGSTLLSVALEVENLKRSPMDFMYLAHVNFRPVEGCTIHDNATGIRLRTELPAHVAPAPDFDATMARLAADPDAHRQIAADAVYDPEFVFFLDFTGEEAIALSRHPDGSGDVIRYATAALPRCCRWISRTPDQDCLGLALPGTAEPEGKTREWAKGNAWSLGPRETYRCAYEIGYLDPPAAERLAVELGGAG